MLWHKPEYTGGCPILSYVLLMKGTLDADFQPIDVAMIENKPYLTQHDVTQGLDQLGSIYQFQIRVVNEIGYATSDAADFVLAAVPDRPFNTPAQNMAHTNAEQINVVWDYLTTAQNGGAPILGYDLWRDDGASGDFESLFFTDTTIAASFTDLQVETSLVYRYMYRCRNLNGWGEFSEPGYLYAANVPG
jgi:hypothetical protein